MCAFKCVCSCLRERMRSYVSACVCSCVQECVCACVCVCVLSSYIGIIRYDHSPLIRAREFQAIESLQIAYGSGLGRGGGNTCSYVTRREVGRYLHRTDTYELWLPTNKLKTNVKRNKTVLCLPRMRTGIWIGRPRVLFDLFYLRAEYSPLTFQM